MFLLTEGWKNIDNLKYSFKALIFILCHWKGSRSTIIYTDIYRINILVLVVNSPEKLAIEKNGLQTNETR